MRIEVLPGISELSGSMTASLAAQASISKVGLTNAKLQGFASELTASLTFNSRKARKHSFGTATCLAAIIAGYDDEGLLMLRRNI